MLRGDDMEKQDSNGVRTAQDIERKYDFGKMLGLTKNIETQEKGLIQIQNTLNDMLNALVINLKDVLDSQSDVSLWFYSGVPTNLTEPYISWQDPSDHYGDIYYDTNEGKVYQFYESSGVWEVNANPDLLRAMALTNSEIDTTIDHERKVFFTTPTVPYASGDWWILSDGTLKVCQIGKSTGTYEEQDFINSALYSPTISEKFEEVITVLKGTITTLSEDYVQFTDLATGGSTTIAGENIKTGNIESNNYVSNVSGTKIGLLDGTIDAKNFKLDSSGNVRLGNGAKVMGGDGLLTNLQFASRNGVETQFGINYEFQSGSNIGYKAQPLKITATIPDNFTIVESKLTLVHIPVKWEGSQWGYARNIGVYKQSLNNKFEMDFNSDFVYITEPTYTLCEDIFEGEDTWQPSIPDNNDYPIEVITTSDLELEQGLNMLVVKTTTVPSGTTTAYNTAKLECEKQSGLAVAILDVYGYTSYDEEGE